jgi:hypothetical protein
MYKLHRTNELGQLLGSKGMYAFGKERDEELILSFNTIEAAKRYAKAYVRRYPQAYCSLFVNNDSEQAIEIIENHEYQRSRLEWQKGIQKVNKDKKCVGLILLWLLAVPIFLLSYCLFNLGVNMMLSLIIVLTSIGLVWFAIERFFKTNKTCLKI